MSVLTEKWAKVLDLEGCPAITDAHRRDVVAQLIENQVRALKEAAQSRDYFTMLNEEGNVAGGFAAGMSQDGANAGPSASYDPVLINLVRRAMPQLMAFDVCGVQPMTMPTGLIFALKSRYGTREGAEALFHEADTAFSGDKSADAPVHTAGDWVNADIEADPFDFSAGRAMSTARAEALGSGDSAWGEMAFSIERTSVVARSRALKAEYTMELAHDLKAVHGLDAESELNKILQTEIISEINREMIRDLYVIAEVGCASGCQKKGIFDLDLDSDGRWQAEKYNSLLMRIEREANAIGHRTRRGRGNFIVCSADVASALYISGKLNYTTALENKLDVDDTQRTFAGVLNGKYKVYIDPYQSNYSNDQFLVMGYKGANAYDAGMFYCPYVPLQLVRAQDPNTMQPKIGFKTRYGLAFNPMVVSDAQIEGYAGANVEPLQLANKNYYYRKMIVRSL